MSPNCHPFSKSSNMATQFFHKILSVFHRQPTKRENQHSFRTVNRVFGDWATSTREDLPPPYTDSTKGKTHFQHMRYSPPPPFVCPRLQICPHEMQSLEDLQKIVNPLTIGNTNETIDATIINPPLLPITQRTSAYPHLAY